MRMRRRRGRSLCGIEAAGEGGEGGVGKCVVDMEIGWGIGRVSEVNGGGGAKAYWEVK